MLSHTCLVGACLQRVRGRGYRLNRERLHMQTCGIKNCDYAREHGGTFRCGYCKTLRAEATKDFDEAFTKLHLDHSRRLKELDKNPVQLLFHSDEAYVELIRKIAEAEERKVSEAIYTTFPEAANAYTTAAEDRDKAPYDGLPMKDIKAPYLGSFLRPSTLKFPVVKFPEVIIIPKVIGGAEDYAMRDLKESKFVKKINEEAAKELRLAKKAKLRSRATAPNRYVKEFIQPEPIVTAWGGSRQSGKTQAALDWLKEASEGINRIIVCPNAAARDHTRTRAVEMGIDRPCSKIVTQFDTNRFRGVRIHEVWVDEAVMLIESLIGHPVTHMTWSEQH